MALALLTATCFQTGETLYMSAIYYLRKCMSRKLNRSALSASQVTAGLHCLFAVSPQDDHVKPAGCRDGNNKSSFTIAPGWERQSRTHQCYKQGGAAAVGAGNRGAVGCLPWLLLLPKSWHLVALIPLCSFTSPQNHKQSLFTLDFAYSAEKFGAAVIYQITELQLTNINL